MSDPDAADYLPARADFAFPASLAEQRGFVGSVILLLSHISSWSARAAVVTGDPLGRSSLEAVFAFLFQVFVNIGETMGMAPSGIPLPFVTVEGPRWSRTSS